MVSRSVEEGFSGPDEDGAAGQGDRADWRPEDESGDEGYVRTDDNPSPDRDLREEMARLVRKKILHGPWGDEQGGGGDFVPDQWDRRGIQEE